MYDGGEALPIVVGDTCSGCHLAALKQSVGRGDYQVIFASFHVDVSETPFFVAVDYDHQSVVISVRGTISMKVIPFLNDRFIMNNQPWSSKNVLLFSIPIIETMQDVITDLHAEAEPIPLQLTRDDWFGHKVNSRDLQDRNSFKWNSDH